MNQDTRTPLVWLIRLVTIGCVLSLTGYLGRYHFLFEQIDSFRLQYCIAAGIFLLLACIARQWLAAALLISVSALHASELSGFYLSADNTGDSHHATPHLRVMTANLLASNRDTSALLDEINRINPDVIVFQEYTAYWHQILSQALSSHPHRIYEIINSPFGIAGYSRQPLLQQRIAYFNQALSPAVDMVLRHQSVSVRILGIHPIPPVNAAAYRARNLYFDDVAEFTERTDGALVVMGDFNATPWSWHFNGLLEQGKLISTRNGFGIHPTWPATFWPLWTPIDHITHNAKWQTIRFDSGKPFGSDHIPLWADLVLVAH